MPGRIVVSGMGMYTAMGKGIEVNFSQLKNETPALSALEYLQTIYAAEFPFGEIKTVFPFARL